MIFNKFISSDGRFQEIYNDAEHTLYASAIQKARPYYEYKQGHYILYNPNAIKINTFPMKIKHIRAPKNTRINLYHLKLNKDYFKLTEHNHNIHISEQSEQQKNSILEKHSIPILYPITQKTGINMPVQLKKFYSEFSQFSELYKKIKHPHNFPCDLSNIENWTQHEKVNFLTFCLKNKSHSGIILLFPYLPNPLIKNLFNPNTSLWRLLGVSNTINVSKSIFEKLNSINDDKNYLFKKDEKHEKHEKHEIYLTQSTSASSIGHTKQTNDFMELHFKSHKMNFKKTETVKSCCFLI